MNRLDQAFQVIERANFLPVTSRYKADVDTPISIGYGQTNSQPLTVRLMLGWLSPQLSEKILDVGSGSGWTTALLSYLIGPTGEVYAVEKIPELVVFGRQNCQRLGIHNAHFFEADKGYGLPKFAPYDRVLVSAAATDMPHNLVAQLKVGGRLVIPINASLYVIDKTSTRNYTSMEHSGFAFVPLV